MLSGVSPAAFRLLMSCSCFWVYERNATLKKNVAGCFKTLVSTSQTKRCHILEFSGVEMLDITALVCLNPHARVFIDVKQSCK